MECLRPTFDAGCLASYPISLFLNLALYMQCVTAASLLTRPVSFRRLKVQSEKFLTVIEKKFNSCSLTSLLYICTIAEVFKV